MFDKLKKLNVTLLIGILLMLASSGLDGIYMTLWMPTKVWYLGLFLNTASDIADLYLGSRMGKYMRSSDSAKRWGGMVLLGLGQVIAIAYSWFFGYLQLRRVLPPIEGIQSNLIALVSAGFIPLLLGFLGIEDGINNFSSKKFLVEQLPPEPKLLACKVCGATHSKSGTPFTDKQQLIGHQKAHSKKPKSNGEHPERVESETLYVQP